MTKNEFIEKMSELDVEFDLWFKKLIDSTKKDA